MKMKRIYKTALFALTCNLALAQSFFVPTTYRGAFAPVPTAMWTDTWANWDPQNTIYPVSTVTITANVGSNTTWTSGNTYKLSGQIYVKNASTLKIEPGTVILGDKAVAGAGLFVCKGSKIMAMGTAAQPIVFTSDQAPGARALADWGGVILMGKASNNQPGGIANIEGIAPSADTEYGGGASPDDNDNSGTMQYVRIEWGGYVYQPNKEINGLTFGSVGSGTTIDHIQVSFSNDDAFEWFGGTVNCRYLVSYRNLDDDFDTDFGFRGHIQFGLSVRDPNIADDPLVSTSEGFESDNDATGTLNTPQTAAVFSNMTLIGPYRGNTGNSIAAGYRRGARIRRNSALKIYNSVFMDHQRGVHIDGYYCEKNAESGALKFMNNIVAGNTTGKVCEVSTYTLAPGWVKTFTVTAWFGASKNDSLIATTGILLSAYSYTNPDYRPATGSLALTGFSFTDASISSFVLMAPTVTGTVTYCQNATANALTATATGINTLMWYTVSTGGTGSSTAPTPNTATAGITIYYVSQIDVYADESSRASITVTVNATPTVAIVANGPTSFCTGGSVVLTATSGGASYLWKNGSSTLSVTTSTMSVSSSGDYSSIFTDVNGCAGTSNVITVSSSSAPVPTVTKSGSTTLCQGSTITLTSSQAETYMWSNGKTTQGIVVSTAATYFVTTTNTADPCLGVGASTNIVVSVSTLPTADFTSSTTNANVTFTDASTGATSYSYDFGDGNNSSSASPVHAYAANGTYTVTLTVMNNSGCSSTKQATVSITVGIEELDNLSSVSLFPNPLNNQAKIELILTDRNNITINIYDITGKSVMNVINQKLDAGIHTINIDASEIPAGIYFTRISTEKSTKILKMIVVK